VTCSGPPPDNSLLFDGQPFLPIECRISYSKGLLRGSRLELKPPNSSFYIIVVLQPSCSVPCRNLPFLPLAGILSPNAPVVAKPQRCGRLTVCWAEKEAENIILGCVPGAESKKSYPLSIPAFPCITYIVHPPLKKALKTRLASFPTKRIGYHRSYG